MQADAPDWSGSGPMEPPLPPARTRMPADVTPSAEEPGLPAPPFVPGRAAATEPVAPASEGPSLSAASAPLDVMPWEQELPPHLEAGPSVTAEAGTAAAPTEVEEWAAALPESDGEAVPPWDEEAEPIIPSVEAAQPEQAPAEPATSFPVDAFIIPEDSRRIPAGQELTDELQRHMAHELADRLDILAENLRRSGFAAFLEASPDHEPVDVVLAAVLSGYIARKAH